MSAAAAAAPGDADTDVAAAAAAVADVNLSLSTDNASPLPERDPRYPLNVVYCPVCSLPVELHEYHSKGQFEKCSVWLRVHVPHLFPDHFPEEAAAYLAAEAAGELPSAAADGGDGDGSGAAGGGDGGDAPKKVAVPIEQKTSGGKKKKAPAEVVLALGQRKGKKQVTIVFGLDLFGIKLKDAAKAAKRKFATGSSLATSPDNRDVIEIQGSRQNDMAQLVHKEWGVPQEAIFIVNAQKKKVNAFA